MTVNDVIFQYGEPWSMVAEEALDDYDLVKLGTAPNGALKCGANELAIGVLIHGGAIGNHVSVYPLTGVFGVRASTTVTQGVRVKAAADGEVVASATTGTTVQNVIGVALKAATAANEIIPCTPGAKPFLPAAS